MIQFNLLPDVKLDYLKARHVKRTVITASLLIGGAALAIFVLLLLTVHVFQKKNISDLTADIKRDSAQLQNTPNLNKILTIQNQLKVLPGLHDQKAVASRVLPYLQQITPTDVTISDATVDFTQNTATISGQAPGLDRINTFTDTLKFTTYTSDGGQTNTQKAFSDVVLSKFGRSDKAATYTITATFDPIIFSSTSNVTLSVPKIVSTRSAIEQPTDIFQKVPATNTGNQ